MRKFVLLTLLTVPTLFLAACAYAPKPADPALMPAREIFRERCSMCHSIYRPLWKNKTREEWSTTVHRMQTKAPDKISDKDVGEVINYLSAVRPPK